MAKVRLIDIPMILTGLLFSTLLVVFNQGPLARLINYSANYAMPNEMSPEVYLIDQRRKGVITKEQFYYRMQLLGYDEQVAEAMYKTSEKFLVSSEAINLYRRGIITDDEFYEAMRKQGFEKDTADKMLRASEFLPGPSDLIRFAVREVYRDDLVKRFGYDEGFPSDSRIAEIKAMSPTEREKLTGMDKLIADALKIGMPPEWLKNYWRAHWDLPSISLALDMFHRLKESDDENLRVSEDDIKTLLRQQDVLPWWIPRILAVSYRLPTRIDIRRMIRYGLISPDEGEKLYRQLGYSDEHAKMMTAIAVMDALGEERDLSVGMIKKAYVLGEIKEDKARELLKDLNYSDEAIDVLIDTWELEQKEKETEDKIKTIVDLYLTDAINEDRLYIELDKLNLPASRRDRVAANAIRRKRGKRKEITKDDIKDFYQKNIISKSQAVELLLKKGYSEQETAWLVQAWDFDKKAS